MELDGRTVAGAVGRGGLLLAAVLAALSVGVAGGFGIVSRDLRSFEAAPAGGVTAVEGYVAEARAREIEPVIVYIPDREAESYEQGRLLRDHFKDCHFIVAENALIGKPDRHVQQSDHYKSLMAHDLNLYMPLLDLEQQLGAGPDDLERRRPDEEQVRAGVHSPQRPVEGDAVERAARCRVDRQAERLAAREHHLDRLAGGDGVLGHPDGVDVLVATEARLPGAAELASRRRCSSRRKIAGPFAVS